MKDDIKKILLTGVVCLGTMWIVGKIPVLKKFINLTQ